uniref:Uncharacterized protein n=1 Tax=Chromera velia CCMP2878 TaxID=1169474 RepID=A0A0G4HMT3_9ALVE|eukprot:Cvel_29270.t1-p1 / transcript=Cvel_29270.t1 / gene=Cvel_29270 / organism=Chromera_velia_CCMP2878 / gene_product=hypothetical protein / transcript_product=hypothetical protein / location=Cvel_scaffold3973:3166-11342(-) / protein_length=216 / sequence_SO=supercontig / SO=protein_coding / is_pseudo=false
MLKQCEGARMNGDDVHALALALDRLRSADEGAGKAWEAVVAVALGLRLLGLSVGVEWERLQPCPDIKSLAPGDLESFGGMIRLHSEAFSAEELKAAMRKRLEKGLSTLNGRIGFLVLLMSARFAKYDLFVCACTPGLKNIEPGATTARKAVLFILCHRERDLHKSFRQGSSMSSFGQSLVKCGTSSARGCGGFILPAVLSQKAQCKAVFAPENEDE